MNKIKKFTICLHCGCSRDVVNAQMDALSQLDLKYKVTWNNRIDRHPDIYESYSELINHSVSTTDDEWIILINDRTHPTVDEVEKMLNLLENGYACVLLYNVGFMGFSKQLIRHIGWWDQRFTNGGWEDRDWVWRIKKANLALYESQESTYDMSWKSPLNIPGAVLSGQFWGRKYDTSSHVVYKKLREENYPEWDKTLGDQKKDIQESWMTWDNSQLDIMYNQIDRPGSGPSGSTILANRNIVELL
tara:strand:- start:5842 stop:6579 length:738 start_codon:yes stop_codon:yes gene_type:complete